MRLLIDMSHPGHVHLYKHTIWHLQEQGNQVLIAARDKDVTLALLEHYELPYQTVSAIGQGLLGLYGEFIQRELALVRLIREFKPDIVTGIRSILIVPACKIMRKPAIVFTDTEHIAIDRYLTHPFANLICTPQSFKRDFGRRHIRYAGYHELAYLHPNCFRPNPTILDELGVSAGEPFIILRFVSWGASHDVGQTGFLPAFKREMVQILSRYGKIFITSEEELPVEIEAFRISVSPHKIHDVLAYAQLYIGEGATMASEAAMLGTPAIFLNTLSLGYLDELERDYGLAYSFTDQEKALKKAIELLDDQEIKTKMKLKREELLATKVDVTQWMVDLIENYPQ